MYKVPPQGGTLLFRLTLEEDIFSKKVLLGGPCSYNLAKTCRKVIVFFLSMTGLLHAKPDSCLTDVYSVFLVHLSGPHAATCQSTSGQSGWCVEEQSVLVEKYWKGLALNSQKVFKCKVTDPKRKIKI